MQTANCQGSPLGSWRDLYQAAVLEPDLNKLAERIVEAETALTVRARELFYATADDIQEGESLDDAMCILRVLRSSLQHRDATVISRTRDLDYLRGK